MSFRQRIALLICIWTVLLSLGGGAIGGDPSPIPDLGFRVLITYPDSTRDQLPPGQKALLVSQTLRDWLDGHCVKDSHGDSEWRIVKDTTTFGPDQPIWQKLITVPRVKSDWVVASNGKNGVSTELPVDEAPLITLLTPLAGGK